MTRLLIATLVFTTLSLAQTIDERLAQHDKEWKDGNFRKAEAGYQALQKHCAEKSCIRAEVALLHNNYGAMLITQGRHALAREQLLLASKTYEEIGQAYDGHRAIALVNIGEACRHLAKFEEGETAFLQALEIRKRLFREPAEELPAVMMALAVLYRDFGRSRESSAVAEQALAFYESGKLAEDLHYATLLDLRGLAARERHALTHAAQAYRRALETRQRISPGNNILLALSYNNLGAVMMDQSELTGARENLEKALQMRLEAHGPDHPGLASVYANLASCLQGLGDLENAATYGQKAVAVAIAGLGANHPTIGVALNNLAEIQLASDKPAAAEPNLRKAVEIMEVSTPNSAMLATCLANLAHLFVRREKHKGAEKLLTRALRIYEQAHSPDDPAYHRLGRALAQVYRLQHRDTEAQRFERNAFRFR